MRWLIQSCMLAWKPPHVFLAGAGSPGGERHAAVDRRKGDDAGPAHPAIRTSGTQHLPFSSPVTDFETVRKLGVPFAPGYNLPYQENGRGRVQWRVIVDLSSTVGAKQVHEVHVGGNATPGCSAATLGLSLAEAKSVLAGLQRHLVQTQAEEH
jgi:hypothetical protein